jgi:hypothetical protein
MTPMMTHQPNGVRPILRPQINDQLPASPRSVLGGLRTGELPHAVADKLPIGAALSDLPDLAPVIEISGGV